MGLICMNFWTAMTRVSRRLARWRTGKPRWRRSGAKPSPRVTSPSPKFGIQKRRTPIRKFCLRLRRSKVPLLTFFYGGFEKKLQVLTDRQVIVLSHEKEPKFFIFRTYLTELECHRCRTTTVTVTFTIAVSLFLSLTHSLQV